MIDYPALCKEIEKTDAVGRRSALRRATDRVFGALEAQGSVPAATDALAALIVGIMMPQFAFMNGIGIVLGVILPIFCIFFAAPLSKAVKGRKDFMPKNLGEYIAENFFEMFEYALSYLSNSMSFLRVGGFILSHAGMMSVVMTLSEMTSNPVVNPIIVICGNLFVMALEGLIVGIQVLRLEFYEMFSRFYEGNGTAYAPIQVSYEMKIE